LADWLNRFAQTKPAKPPPTITIVFGSVLLSNFNEMYLNV